MFWVQTSKFATVVVTRTRLKYIPKCYRVYYNIIFI